MIYILIFAFLAITTGTQNMTISQYGDLEQLPKETLTIMLMGDTQYHYKCEPANTRCKKSSAACREKYNLNLYLHSRHGNVNKTVKNGQLECTKLESRYANKIQRQGIVNFIRRCKYPPAALIINGDLTDFGHVEQFKEFKKGWMNSFPIPILAGLGNHDYENNIDDCALNFCAHNMLSWLTKYADNNSLHLEYERIVKSPFDVSYNGSFAYATRVCSITGTNCAHVIQLNNAIDYATKFSSFFAEWSVYSAMEFLKRELTKVKDLDIPVLINMHQCEGTRREKLKQLISDWIYETRNLGHRKRIAVFYAHMHALHQVKVYCMHGVSVPFVYVGSVTNNRFSVLQIEKNKTSLSGYSAMDHFENSDQFKTLGAINIWEKCEPSKPKYHFFRN